MVTMLADLVARAATTARRHAQRFPGVLAKDRLPWAVIEAYDADVRGHLERDPRIEDERDRVLIAAVKLAGRRRSTRKTRSTPPRRPRGRDRLSGQAVLRFGLANRQAVKLASARRAAGSGMSPRRPAPRISAQRAAAFTAAGRITCPLAILDGQMATCLPPCHCARRPVT